METIILIACIILLFASIAYNVSLNFKVTKLKEQLESFSKREKEKIKALLEDEEEKIKAFLKEKKGDEKKIFELRYELYLLQQEETIQRLKKPVILLAGNNDNHDTFISIKDGEGICYDFEGSAEIKEMKPSFRSLFLAAHPIDGTGWKKKGAVLFK